MGKKESVYFYRPHRDFIINTKGYRYFPSITLTLLSIPPLSLSFPPSLPLFLSLPPSISLSPCLSYPEYNWEERECNRCPKADSWNDRYSISYGWVKTLITISCVAKSNKPEKTPKPIHYQIQDNKTTLSLRERGN